MEVIKTVEGPSGDCVTITRLASGVGSEVAGSAGEATVGAGGCGVAAD